MLWRTRRRTTPGTRCSRTRQGGRLQSRWGTSSPRRSGSTYASPDSLRLLMFKRIVGARNISVDDVPTYMDEFDELEAVLLLEGQKDPNAMKDAKLRGLYEYTVLTSVPGGPGVHVPYRQVAELAAVAPEGAVEEFVTKRLISNGAVAGPSPELSTRIGWAAKWAADSNLRVAKAAESGPPKAKLASPGLGRQDRHRPPFVRGGPRSVQDLRRDPGRRIRIDPEQRHGTGQVLLRHLPDSPRDREGTEAGSHT